MSKKKDIERRYLNSFLKTLELEVKSIEDSETPDFILQTDKQTISIELTRLINQDLKIVEEFRNSVIRRAHEDFKLRYGKSLYCLIGLRNIKLGATRSARTEQIEKYSAKLFDRVERIYLDNSNKEFDVTLEHINDADDILTRLHAKTSDDFDHWQYFGAHRVDWIEMNWFIKRIKEKEAKIDQYRQVFDENWLLLISNTGTKPSAHRFDFLDFSQVDAKFEKVFVYKSIENRIITIK
jgi:hypothetical protein